MKIFPTVNDLQRAHGVTWGELTDLEPQLLELLWQARAAAQQVDFHHVHRACHQLAALGQILLPVCPGSLIGRTEQFKDCD